MASPYPNMSVPGAISPAGQALGLGDQVAGETEEERRKRLQVLQARQQQINDATTGSGYGAALSLSPAGSALGLGG